MKRCSTCNRTYEDSSLNYCLADGAPLVTSDSEPTVVLPRTEKKTNKGRVLLWLALAAFGLAAGVVVLAAVLIYKFAGDGGTIGVDPQTNRPISTSSPKPKTSPTPTPSPNKDEQANAGDPPPQPPIEDSDEVTPILWETTASGFKGEPGKTYRFQCPANGTERAVFGSDIYTDYSSICTAAVHVGAITLEEGGGVIMEYRPGRTIYGSTDRNGIKTNTSGENPRSFLIRSDEKE